MEDKKLKELREEYIKNLINYYGKGEFHLSQDVLTEFFNEYAKDLRGSVIELIIRERLFYLANPNSTFQDYYEYRKKKGEI